TAAQALERAKAFAEESGVGVIGPLDLERFEQDPDRTLYLLDVRDPPEFRAGHLTGSRSAPGGQLVQATDTWIGVRNARIVLVDDTGVRARMSAAWLRQMGHRDVFVLEGAVLTSKVPEVEVPELSAAVDTIDVAGLQARLDARDGTVVLDLTRSIDFRDGHVPGAIWGVRTRLKPGDIRGKRVVITSPDAVAARLAVPEVKGLGATQVQVLQGGTQAWVAAGKPVEKNRLIPSDDECIDFYLRAYDRNSGIEEAMKAYLSWEIDLVHEIERDGTVAFGIPGDETHAAA
ncbi:MAG: rhodanese-related sulfurtransferase, partial [Proteobacteria bacterium]|nr:rhodanese-related sulfurtransferase [Pseudomonadota bacterium]